MIHTVDLAISVSYIIAIVAIGMYAGMRKKKAAGNASNGYFLAGKSLRWPAIGLALFATNISCVHLVSLAQSGFDTGLLNGNFEWMASFTLILLALFFVPFYIKSGVTTLPDFLERRYNRASRDWLTGISILSAIIIHIAFSLLAGGIVIETLIGVNMYISILVICILVGLYTIVGGLSAVVITESIQSVVLVIGAIIISVACWKKAGGWEPMVDFLQHTGQMNKLSMLRPGNDASHMPWYSIFLGYPVLGIWYWCADQTIVQRVLGAKDENHARIGSLFCAFIKILPVFIFVLPGLFTYVLAQKGLINLDSITSISATGEKIVNSKGIYTLMITQLLPTGLVGILIAALLSGLMSQISGALNSIATLISFDLYKRVNENASDKQLIKVGRLSAGICLVLSILLLPLLNSYESLFNGLNDIIAHIAPPITCVFLLGIFWSKASAKSAQYTLWIGSLLGVAVFIFSKTYGTQIPFMMTAFYLFSFCLVLQVSLSYVFPIVYTAENRELFWKHPFDPLKRPAWAGIGNYRTLSVILLVSMICLYYLFR